MQTESFFGKTKLFLIRASEAAVRLAHMPVIDGDANILSPVGRFQSSVREMKKTKTMVTAALLVAMQVMLGFVASIGLGPYIRISFGYLAVAVEAVLFGPFVAMLGNMLSDIILCIIHPMGPYFFGFTLSAMLGGLIYGFAFYRRPITLQTVLAAKLIIDVFVNIMLGSLWLNILYGKAFSVYLLSRIVKNAVQYPVDIILLLPILRGVSQLRKRNLL